jgi:serine/threonine-protein kinase
VGFSLHEPLNHDLRGYLYQIQQAEWFSSQDTPKVLQEILGAIASPITDYVSASDDFNLTNKPTISEQVVTNSAVNLPESMPLPNAEPEIPGGQVGIESTFYMERPPIEERCFQTILQPSALIRIKAPRQLGKTSLMARILASASQANYRTVSLSFQLVDKHIFANLDQFLKWFCAYVGRELNLPNQLNDYWDDIFGSKVNCKDYFEKYLLTQIDEPLVLGLDELDRVFQYPDIAEDFLGLLRAWHEESKRRAIWKKLRLIMVHSTEVYIPMNINQSPFNVGLPIELPEFTAAQILELAGRHDLDWSNIQVEQVMSLIGGHPYLIRVALYHIAGGDVSLSEWQNTAISETGIYSDHLRRHLWNLEQNPELLGAMQQVINNPAGCQLASIIAFKLDSMGLVKLQGNLVSCRCELYRQYLQLHLQ